MRNNSPGKKSRKKNKKFCKKLLTNCPDYDIMYTERGESKSPEKERKRKMNRTLKAYKNTKTLEVIAGYGSRKLWKQRKECCGKPSDWKRIDPKGWY